MTTADGHQQGNVSAEVMNDPKTTLTKSSKSRTGQGA